MGFFFNSRLRLGIRISHSKRLESPGGRKASYESSLCDVHGHTGSFFSPPSAAFRRGPGFLASFPYPFLRSFRGRLVAFQRGGGEAYLRDVLVRVIAGRKLESFLSSVGECGVCVVRVAQFARLSLVKALRFFRPHSTEENRKGAFLARSSRKGVRYY